jgi:hypothetical protein
MDYSDILQDISVDLSFMVKKHLKNIKKLDSKKQRAFGKLFADMKNGVDDLSEGVNESVNEVDTKKANLLRTNMPGYVGTKFAKKASDEDLIKMADLKTQKAKIHNKDIVPLLQAQDKLYKSYKIKSVRGIEK